MCQTGKNITKKTLDNASTKYYTMGANAYKILSSQAGQNEMCTAVSVSWKNGVYILGKNPQMYFRISLKCK